MGSLLFYPNPLEYGVKQPEIIELVRLNFLAFHRQEWSLAILLCICEVGYNHKHDDTPKTGTTENTSQAETLFQKLFEERREKKSAHFFRKKLFFFSMLGTHILDHMLLFH